MGSMTGRWSDGEKWRMVVRVMWESVALGRLAFRST